ncbi:hypothetical protein LEP1GSC016_1231 [Leptospira borgpetersenii serovar Hardjo-bovis str. Sponselee]|uniref:Uncharacterized protein n=1 Tax=Leptospira borgpetersenii serovar Hardjo-bovis str. Sponselee TaxID=1303729 RepID=M6BX48_LEPBO|nr:hypothetical protein LEP1GSC016_1231 [Leptospira borgpetersenii serovar Hardjo-bovis str. Sponselee]
MVIYGFLTDFYRWNTLVGIPTFEVLGQVLICGNITRIV